MAQQVRELEKVEVCEWCGGTGVYTTYDETGENFHRQPCIECAMDPEPEEEL